MRVWPRLYALRREVKAFLE